MVEFQLMTRADFEVWRSVSIANYAKDNVSSGKWTSAEAVSRSEEEFSTLLPDGLATPENYLRFIVNEQTSERVGVVWYALRREKGRSYIFVYDFEIYEEYRRRGYGTKALLYLDGVVRQMGQDMIALRVFGRNRAARGLYEKAGYEETDIIMSKKL